MRDSITDSIIYSATFHRITVSLFGFVCNIVRDDGDHARLHLRPGTNAKRRLKYSKSDKKIVCSHSAVE